MEDRIENLVSQSPKLVEEAFEELTGESKRKWALMAVAFLLGAAIVVLIVKTVNRRNPETIRAPDTDTTAPESEEPGKGSRWSDRRAQIARADAAMRGRVGRAGSRLHHGGRKS